MAFENADEIVMWVRRNQILQPLVIGDRVAVPSIRLTGPGNLNWKVLIGSGTNAGAFKLTLQDRLNNTVEIYDNLVVSPLTSVDFITARINGVSKLPMTVEYLGNAAGNPANGIYTPIGIVNFEVRAEGFRTLPKASGQHETLRYMVDQADLLSGLAPALTANAIDVINAILVQVQTKLGI